VIRKLPVVISLASVVVAPRAMRAQGEAAVAPDSIVVLGLRRVDRKQVLEQSGLSPGRPLGYRDVQRAIQALYGTGQFADVRVAQDTGQGRQLLVIRVHERPILLKWAVRGVDKVSEGSVRDKAQLAEGRPLDPAAVARARGRRPGHLRHRRRPPGGRVASGARGEHASPDRRAGGPDEDPARGVLVVPLG